nr:hypothetical protein [Tanacetum cinerariifolium]
VSQEPSIPSPTPPTPPPQPPQDLLSTSQVYHTPPQSPQAQPQPQPQQAVDFPMSLLQEALDAYAALTRRAEHLEYDKVAQALEITKLKRSVKKLDKGNRVRVLKLIRIIDEMDKEDDVVALMDDKEEDKKDEEAKEDEPAKVQEVVDVVTTAKLITEDVAIDHVKLKAKEDPVVKRYQAMKRKPQIEARARKNMMMYLKNVASFRLEEESKALQRINESPVERAAKIRKLDEEVEDLKRHLEIMPNKDDDVCIEATPLTRKLILLIERRYTLSRFTLDQMLNNVRLQVEEESQVSSIRRHDIFMFTEKDYPLTDDVMILMLSTKLQVDEDYEMVRDLVMKIFMKANKLKSRRSLDTSFK